jgi:hypothetical protein
MKTFKNYKIITNREMLLWTSIYRKTQGNLISVEEECGMAQRIRKGDRKHLKNDPCEFEVCGFRCPNNSNRD